MTLKLVLLGGSGRIGKLIESFLLKDSNWEIIFSANSQTDVNSLLDVVAKSDVIIDFTNKGALEAFLTASIGRGIYRPLVSGTTALTAEGKKLLETYSKNAPVLHENNMATSVNMIFKIAGMLGKHLNPASGFTRKLMEEHHVGKLDAPSGTALSIVENLGGDCLIESKREGDIFGNHTLCFESDEEELIIIHRAKNRNIFAKGAINAANWLVGQPAGRYHMMDYLENV